MLEIQIDRLLEKKLHLFEKLQFENTPKKEKMENKKPLQPIKQTSKTPAKTSRQPQETKIVQKPTITSVATPLTAETEAENMMKRKAKKGTTQILGFFDSEETY